MIVSVPHRVVLEYLSGVQDFAVRFSVLRPNLQSWVIGNYERGQIKDISAALAKDDCDLILGKGLAIIVFRLLVAECSLDRKLLDGLSAAIMAKAIKGVKQSDVNIAVAALQQRLNELPALLRT